jgi:hypothetical protein
VILLLDASASTTIPKNGWNMVTRFLRSFVSSASTDCSFGLIIFGADKIREVKLGEDRKRIIEAINDIERDLPKIKYRKTTAIFDSLQRAADLLVSAKPGDAVYVITDGEDNGSKTNIDRLKNFLLQRQIRLFVFLLDNSYSTRIRPMFAIDDSSLYDSWSQKSLLQISAETGGTNFVLYPSDIKSGSAKAEVTISHQVDKVHNLILNFYRLDLEFPSAEKNAKVALEIFDKDGRRAKDIRLYYSPRLPQ